jgi:hypothetical protein
LPEFPEPTRVFFGGDLFKLAGVKPNAVAASALVDLNLLKASLFQGRTSFRTFHQGSFAGRLLGLRFLLEFQLG